MQALAKPKRRYIGGFDGLRTVGVVGVILYHLRTDLFKGGYLGVPIFLVLTGYLITDGFLRQYQRTGRLALGDYFAKRIKRLYPGLVAVLFASSAYIVLFQRALLFNLHKIVATNLALVYNWWEILNGQSYFQRFANNESPFTHLWTLSIEGQFYLLFPFLFLLVMKWTKSRGKAFNVMFLLAVLSAGWMFVLYSLTMHGPNADPSRLYYGSDTRAFSLLLGAALAFVWPSDKLSTHARPSAKWVLDGVGTLAMAGMVACLFWLSADGGALYRGGMFGFSLLTMLLVAVIAHPSTRWGKLMTNPVFAYIGSRSYGIYLYQFPVMIFWENAVGNIAAHPILYPVIEVLLILIISELSFRFIEQPLARFDYRQTEAAIRALVTGRQGLGPLIVTAISVAVLATGSVGLVQAVSAKDTAADSALEKRLKANKETAAEKKAAVEKARKRLEEERKTKASTTTTSSEVASTSTEVPNAQFIQYGLTADELVRLQTLNVTMVGDSVLLDGKPLLQQLMPNALIDAAVSRQLYTSTGIVAGYANAGALADVVVIALGTNGPFSTAQLGEMMASIGTGRQVFWINAYVPTRGWQNSVNDLLASAPNTYKNLTIIDWHNYAQAHPDWFYADKVHPNPTGNNYYAAFIAKQIIDNVKPAPAAKSGK